MTSVVPPSPELVEALTTLAVKTPLEPLIAPVDSSGPETSKPPPPVMFCCEPPSASLTKSLAPGPPGVPCNTSSQSDLFQ